MLKLIVDNSDKVLAKAILAGDKHIENLMPNELRQLEKIAVNLPPNCVFELTQHAVKPMVPAYQIDEYKPFWFAGDTTFDSDVWQLQLVKWTKTIDFNVKLNDGNRLTAKRHRPLLNSFKKWLLMLGYPLYNGGKLLKPATIQRKLVQVLGLIDALLLNADKIALAQRHMQAVDSDLIMDLLTTLVTGGTTALYRYKKNMIAYLMEKIPLVTDQEALEFAKNHPFVSIPLLPEEVDLPLTQSQRVKACCFLFKQRAYCSGIQVMNTPNCSYFKPIFYANTLQNEILRTQPFKMLQIAPGLQRTEYPAVPVRAVESGTVCDKYLAARLGYFKLLGAIQGAEFSETPVATFANVNLKRVSEHCTIKATGRYTTVPAPVVFKSIKDGFEYCYRYMDDILNTVFNILLNKPADSALLLDYRQTGFMAYVTPSLKQLGVKLFAVDQTESSRFAAQRKHIGMVNMYKVLMGAIQVLVGTTMARRQGEIVELNPVDCLIPGKLDPSSEAAQNTDFELVFDNRKSGIGGQHETRETLAKPILRSVAGLVYKLQLFNVKLMKHKLVKRQSATLLTNFDAGKMRLASCSPAKFNHHFDAFCDYFETQTVQFGENDIRRYYLRQHQLRRFFAMVFFWSKGFDGLDTLRHFLAHTDSAHLYHYVTEGVPGEVLTGIKAKRIQEGVHNKDIENIEALGKILLKRFGVKSLTFKTYKKIQEDYAEDVEDGFFVTVPPLAQVKQQFEQVLISFEQDISRLLLDHTIDLQPEFFTINDEDGQSITDYKLVLKVRELDDDEA